MPDLYAINGSFDYAFQTTSPLTGAAMDATGTPTWRSYESGTDAVVATGNAALKDDANTTGLYVVTDTVTVAKGYEVGKSYDVRVAATVDGAATAAIVGRFKVVAVVDIPATADIVDAVWEEPLADHATGTTFGGGLAVAGDAMDLVNAPNATALSAIGTAVWASTVRTLTSLSALTASIAAAVWSYASRVLTASIAGTSSSITTDAAITIVKGDDTTLAFTWAGVNITGYTFWFTVKSTMASLDQEDHAALIQVAGVITDAATGQLSVTLTHGDTAIPAGTYYYDVQAKVTATGVLTTIQRGTLTVGWAVTNKE